MYGDKYDSTTESYLIILGDSETETEINVFVKTRQQLKQMISILPDKYELLNINIISDVLQLHEFIEDIKQETKPKDLEFGVDNTDGKDNNIL